MLDEPLQNGHTYQRASQHNINHMSALQRAHQTLLVSEDVVICSINLGAYLKAVGPNTSVKSVLKMILVRTCSTRCFMLKCLDDRY